MPEVLVTTAIIGTISAAAMVSLSSVRVRARDLKRIDDTKQFQTALELFYEAHHGFPNDGVNGAGGITLGEGAGGNLSDIGFADGAKGTSFMIAIPKNPVPFGSRYVYRALNADGTDCTQAVCASYAILFTLEGPQSGLSAGPHAMTPSGVQEPKGFLAEDLKSETVSGVAAAGAKVDSFVTTASTSVVTTVQSEPVQQATEYVVAPTVAAATAFNAAYAASGFGQYLFFFLTQPASLFGIKKRKSWGTVFNAISHMPIDLAIVRLRSDATNRVMQSTVTDGEGRYSFLVPSGTYRIEVAKPGVVFPSVVALSVDEMGNYADLYHGNRIDVGTAGSVLTKNIPVDPDGIDIPDDLILKTQSNKKVHGILALVSPFLGGITLAMRPTPFVALLFLAEIVVYMLFRRLAVVPEAKNWGTVYHQVSEEPVPKAIVRIFSQKYNKLLEAQVTDIFGRYHFRVMDNVYYLTVSKDGYRKTETEPIDLTKVDSPVIIASDLPLAPAAGGLIVATKHQGMPTSKPKSRLVGPTTYGGGPVGRPAPALPDFLAGKDEDAKAAQAPQPEGPLRVPATPDFFKSDGSEVEMKKPEAPKGPLVAPAVPDFFKGSDEEEKKPEPMTTIMEPAVPDFFLETEEEKKAAEAKKAEPPKPPEEKKEPPEPASWFRDS